MRAATRRIKHLRVVAKAKPKADVTGIFRPGLPTDVSEVVVMYAIAARVITHAPDSAKDVTKRLAGINTLLVPPEASAAAHCHKMWRMFTKVATAGKPTMREQAARAYVRDLEQVGRGWDIPPIAGWDDLPQGVDAPNAPTVDLSENTSPGESLAVVRERAKQVKAQKGTLEPQTTADLVRILFPEERDKLFLKLIGDGVLGRSDVSLMVRWLTKGGKLGKEDDALADVLTRLGVWLVT